jgi:hypothetical protein
LAGDWTRPDSTKLPPAVVLARAGGVDWVLCQVTSNAYGDASGAALAGSSFATGGLGRDCLARPGQARQAVHRQRGHRCARRRPVTRPRLSQVIQVFDRPHPSALRYGREPTDEVGVVLQHSDEGVAASVPGLPGGHIVMSDGRRILVMSEGRRTCGSVGTLKTQRSDRPMTINVPCAT